MVQFCVVVPWVLWSTFGGRGLGTEREKSEQTVFARSDFSVSVLRLFLPYMPRIIFGLQRQV